MYLFLNRSLKIDFHKLNYKTRYVIDFSSSYFLARYRTFFRSPHLIHRPYPAPSEVSIRNDVFRNLFKYEQNARYKSITTLTPHEGV